MADEIKGNSEVYNHYLELSKPTKADFERIFTDTELKELCLKHKCRVDMWRWNVANDYRMLFTESGRYQRWSERDRLRMLAKAVNKMKPSVLYDEQEIIKTRKEEWGLQLKENILSLNFWQRKRTRSIDQYNSLRLVVSESEGVDEGVLSQCAVNTESMNMAELLTQPQSQETPTESEPLNKEFQQVVQSQIEVNTESMNVNELLTQSYEQQPPFENINTNVNTSPTQSQGQQLPTNNVSIYNEFDHEVQVELEVNTESMNVNELLTQIQSQQPALEDIPTNRQHSPDHSTQSDEAANILLDELEEEYLIEDDSEDSVETVLNNEQVIIGTLQSEEVAPEIENIYGVNTMSMTIDSQMSTQSQDLPILQSEDVVPNSYDNFKKIIPLTSTQSQNYESEVMS